MKSIPVDVSGLSFLVASDPEAVTDFDTGKPKNNRDGQSLFSVDLLVSGEGRKGELITVKVAGALPSVVQGNKAKVSKLFGSPWQQGTRSGISYSAESVTVTTASSSSKAA